MLPHLQLPDGRGRAWPAARHALSLLGLTLLLAGCCAPPPGLGPDSLAQLERVDQGQVSLYHRPGELTPETSGEVLAHIERARAEVGRRIELSTPDLGVVLYEPCGVPGASGDLYLQTLAVFGSDGRVLFRYPWPADGSLLGPLLGTTAHEVAEASVLDQLTMLDPHLRWVHDGIAEALEHQTLCDLRPEVARSALEKNVQLLRQRAEQGVSWVNLTRWRQVASWLIRSHRFFTSGANLPLDDLAGSLRRVQQELEHANEPALHGWLLELEEVLRRTQAVTRLPYGDGEAQVADPASHDLVFYTAALAVWLEIERQDPGSIRRFLAALRQDRQQDQHVLRASEALALLAAAAPNARLPDLEHLELSWVDGVLSRELEGF